MSENQLQIIQDVIKMTLRLNSDSLVTVKILMEKLIDLQLLKLQPSVILENMDIAEKVMYLDYLMESPEDRKNQEENSLSLEEVLKRERLTIDDLQNNDQTYNLFFI